MWENIRKMKPENLKIFLVEVVTQKNFWGRIIFLGTS